MTQYLTQLLMRLHVMNTLLSQTNDRRKNEKKNKRTLLYKVTV